MKRHFVGRFYALALMGALWLAPAVLTLPLLTGCGTLAPGGAYNSDKVLYDADFAIANSYDLLHNFVTWEYQNRALLASVPEIKAAADKVRVGAPQWVRSALNLRDAYAKSPTGANRDALQKAIDVLRQAVAEATAYTLSGQTLIH